MQRRTGMVQAAVLLAFLAWSAGAGAQTTDRSGIEGKVVDQGGGVLPGVTVTIASPALQGGARATVTDARGAVPVRGPAGRHLPGHASNWPASPRSSATCASTPGSSRRSTRRCGSAESQESVTVHGRSRRRRHPDHRRQHEPGQGGAREPADLPQHVAGHEPRPGLRVTGCRRRRHGGRHAAELLELRHVDGRQQAVLDGVDTREDAGGAGFYYDYGAFQEVQIKAMGNDAEMATPGTQFLGILKSGGDQFHGSGLLRLGDAAASRATTSPTSCGREASRTGIR